MARRRRRTRRRPVARRTRAVVRAVRTRVRRRRARRAPTGSAPRFFIMPRRTARRARRRRSGFGGARRGFLDTGLLIQGVAAAAGALAVNMIAAKIPATWTNSDTKKIAVQAGIALAVAYAARRALPKYANAIGIGAAATPAAGVVAKAVAAVGVKGLGYAYQDGQPTAYGMLSGSPTEEEIRAQIAEGYASAMN